MKRLPRSAVLDALAPGGRVIRVERLRGGVSCSVHAVKLESADGSRSEVVVRRFTSAYHTDNGVAPREFRALHVLTSLSYPCPRPLLLELDDTVFGAPTIVMTRLPGAGTLAPRDVHSYLEQLARALVQLHRLPTDEFSFLPLERDYLQRMMERGPQSTDPLQLELWEGMRQKYAAGLRPERRVVLHGDFWPGNTVWHRGRLSGVVDWEGVRLGEPAMDVATCRSDVGNIFGVEAARAFAELYERESGEALVDLPFWDLRTATTVLRYLDYWVSGYGDLDRRDLTADSVTARVAELAREALGQLRA